MFDIFLYPVSAILWFWHTIFATPLGAASGLAWVLAVVFLVFTVRALLIRPALAQLRSARRTRELAPQLEKLRTRHRGDRQRLGQEMQKLYADNGVGPLGGCLPALLQIPVFLSLYWVLRDFTSGATSNHVFDRAGVSSFLHADIFGARLGNWIHQPAATLAAAGTDQAHMLAVGLPLMVLAGTVTFLTMRASLRRTPPASEQLAKVTRVMAYLAPFGVVVSGAFFPVPLAVLLYFLATNLWTFGQQHVLTGVVEREEAARQEAAARTATRTTTRGAIPNRAKRGQAAQEQTALSGAGLPGTETTRPQTPRNKAAARQGTRVQTTRGEAARKGKRRQR
jgi:YidC/Oxa1 family membrane protein insertase